jgi:selenide,water dikinase
VRERHLVLVGGGHSHVEVVRRLGQRPIPGVTVTLVSRGRHTPYSGMLPGYIAGHYTHDDVHIDLEALTAAAGIRWLNDRVIGMDPEAKVLTRADGDQLHYDYASLDIGSTPDPGTTDAAEHAIAAKPIDRFDARWRALLERARNTRQRHRIAVVGGGAGGIELILAMHHRLRAERQAAGGDPDALAFALFTRGSTILPTHNRRVQRCFRRLLADRGIALHTDQRVTSVDPQGLRTAAGRRHSADEVIWVTQARGAPWLAATGLECDPGGFIRVRDTLQSISHPSVFAAGDIADMVDHPRAKAGVIAVRQGPPLAHNLRHALQDRPLRAYHPQKRWLALLTMGDRRAVASWGPLSARGGLLWRWKDGIDRRFMRRYQPTR